MTADLILYELAAEDPELRFSPHCWKTRMALAHKGLEATRIAWRLTDKDIIAFSGQGEVPVLVDRGEVITDSWKIACHIERTYPDRPSLFGGDDAVALAGFVNAWADAVLLPAISRIILVDIHGGLAPADKEYFRTSREKRLGQRLEDVVADREGHLSIFRNALAPLRRILKDAPYVSGEAPAYADYCVFGMFMWARSTSSIELVDAGDRVSEWRERLLDHFGGLARSSPRATRIGEAP